MENQEQQQTPNPQQTPSSQSDQNKENMITKHAAAQEVHSQTVKLQKILLLNSGIIGLIYAAGYTGNKWIATGIALIVLIFLTWAYLKNASYQKYLESKYNIQPAKIANFKDLVQD